MDMDAVVSWVMHGGWPGVLGLAALALLAVALLVELDDWAYRRWGWWIVGVERSAWDPDGSAAQASRLGLEDDDEPAWFVS